jgi:arsenical pump membrane protein
VIRSAFVQEVLAYSTFAMTLALVLARPRLGRGRRIGPAGAAVGGVTVMLLSGVLTPADVAAAGWILWRPLVVITSIMIMTVIAQRLEILDWLAAGTDSLAGSSASRLFTCVFGLSALSATVLNNDSAVLLLTPLVVRLVRRRYPRSPELIAPFAFAVFMAAGVAPLVVSNPMNMIAASYAGIGFNEYAASMFPIAGAGWLVAFAVVRIVFRRELRGTPVPTERPRPVPPAGTSQRWAILLLLCVLGAYSPVAYLGGPIWAVAAAGAVLAWLLAVRRGVYRPLAALRAEVSWDILVFLCMVFLIGNGLRNVGAVEHVSWLYTRVGSGTIGVLSALGSALLNNHPMVIINMMALDEVPGAGKREMLAILVGGDLGPRLLPMGSLAGLLWLAALRRLGVDIPLGRFITVGRS